MFEQRQLETDGFKLDLKLLRVSVFLLFSGRLSWLEEQLEPLDLQKHDLSLRWMPLNA